MRLLIQKGRVIDPANDPARPGTAMSFAHPNPTASTVEIRYSVSRLGMVSLVVYDMRGRVVRTLVDGPRCEGEHSVTWDGRNSAGTPVASGMYIAHVDMELPSGGRAE